MRVRDLHLEPLLATSPDEPLADAADRMRFYEIGSLAVLERGEPVAIITERDLVRAVADRSDPDRVSVRSYMTSEPATISADANVVEAGVLMMTLGVRHLPVTNGSALVGMVSIRDLLGAELETHEARSGVSG